MFRKFRGEPEDPAAEPAPAEWREGEAQWSAQGEAATTAPETSSPYASGETSTIALKLGCATAQW